MKRWWRGTFGLVAAVALGFALATLVIGAVAFETTHEALELQLDHRIAIETQALIEAWPIAELRADPQAKRALWPQLRALRRPRSP